MSQCWVFESGVADKKKEVFICLLNKHSKEAEAFSYSRVHLEKYIFCNYRLQNQGGAGLAAGERYTLDQGAVSDIKEVLAEQQRGIQAMMQCVKDDFNDLETIIKKIKNV